MTTNQLMADILSDYPSARINNARAIIRRKIEKMMSMGKQGVSWFQREFGIDLDYIEGQDDGEAPYYSKSSQGEGIPADINDPY